MHAFVHAHTQVVHVDNLWKIYERPRKQAGLGGSLTAFVRRTVEHVEALKGISFCLHAGEILGYIGPNGAGKTTTLKILAGVLHPTRGNADVLGFTPQRREHAFLKQISFVMSGRGFLEEIAWDLSVRDGYEFIRDLYGIPTVSYRQRLDELAALLQLQPFLNTPLRQLSHGQRARAELAAALLWQPRLLLLDEPTLGLDILSQQALRDFVKRYVRRCGAACIVTSHYMRDIEELADRALLIDHGQVVVDGPLGAIVERLSGLRRIRAVFEQAAAPEALATLGHVVAQDRLSATLEVPHGAVKRVAQALLEHFPVSDLTIEEPDLEDVLRRYFAGQHSLSQEGLP